MKKFLLLAAQVALCSILAFANKPEPPNTIAEEDHTETILEESPLDEFQEQQKNLDFKNSLRSGLVDTSTPPGPLENNPPVPIDDYLPLLAVAALGLVAIFHKQIFVK